MLFIFFSATGHWRTLNSSFSIGTHTRSRARLFIL